MKYPNGDMDVVEPELSGVVFWQTFMNSEIVKLSAHFHKAISCLPEMIQAYDA
jgi:hypothetical protein